ncbi:MAG: metal-dependent hydrolase family protein [Candidatus Dormibacteria bacterium]
MAAPVAVLGDLLLDPATGECTPSAVVLVRDGIVVAAGSRESVSVPADAERVDASGLTLMPGMIDAHVHLLARGNGLRPEELLSFSPSQSLLFAAVSCAATVDAGFTTVRDAGGTPAGVRAAVSAGYFRGPRMLLSVTPLGITGGHTDGTMPCGLDLFLIPPMSDVPPSVVDGVEPMRKRVREIFRAGADWIKLCTSGGVLSPGDSPHHQHFTLDEIRAAVSEAEAHGRRVMAHAQATQGIRNALEGGVSTIEHGVWLDDDCLELMLDLRRALVPTLVAPQWVIRHSEAGRMPDWAREKARLVRDDHIASVKRAVEAGVTVAFGTDTGVGPHGSMGEEFLLLRDCGLSPLDCIRSATTVAAAVIGVGGRAGTLAPGAWGDVIGVRGNPLEDLALLSRTDAVELVVKGGEVLKDSRAQAAAAAGARRGQ